MCMKNNRDTPIHLFTLEFFVGWFQNGNARFYFIKKYVLINNYFHFYF